LRLRQLLSRRRLTFEGEYRPVAPVPAFGGALFFQPRGAARHRNDAAIKSVQDLQDAFACLEWLRALRVIHRDLSPRHFLRHQGRLFLIDFGFALLLRVDADLSEESEEASFSGSSFYAPNSVLQVLAVSRTALYRAAFAHDLESLVKLCFADCNAGEKERLKLCDRRAYTSIRDFWQDCEQRMDGQVYGQRWAEALKHARDNKLEETREALLPLFHHR
jgi:serine/threonine protein kinase